MRAIELGRTGIEITTVGLGTFALGGGDWFYGWGHQDESESAATIRHALQAGINWIETAAVYGLGRSEEVIGRALRDVPDADRPLLFTKCGMRWEVNDRFARPARVGAASSLREELDASLRRLGVSCIDLYQMHWPASDGTEIEDYWATLTQMREAGKVRAIGLCNHDLDLVKRAQAVGRVDSLQLPLSAIARDAVGLARWCADNGVAFLAWAPMQAGLLTGAFDQSRVEQLEPGDWRRTSPYFTSDLQANLQVARAVSRIAASRHVSPAAVAVAWVLGCRGVSGAIVGARRPDQIDGWLPAVDLELSTSDTDEIAMAIEASGAGSGPPRPRPAQAPTHPAGGAA